MPGRGERPPPTRSEAAFEALLAEYVALARAATQAPTAEAPSDAAPRAEDDAAAFVDALFAQRERWLARAPYAGIEDAEGFNSKIVGVTFEGRQDTVRALRPGELLELAREPENEHDPNAIVVRYGQLRLGYLGRQQAARLAPVLDAGVRYRVEVTAVTGGGERSTGINIYVSRERETPFAASSAAAARGAVSRDEVRRALIGDRPLRDAQRAVLARVEAGRATLAVLGTGRGKSLCFQFPAAVRALEDGERTVVLYPLRALANDQYEALVRRLAPLGLRIHRANGAIDPGERRALMAALADGAYDIICATPEFLTYHRERFAAHPPALVVVDEAHHLHESRHRAAYGELGTTIAALGARQVLALTATAGDAAFARIREALGIEAWVIDPTVRSNLQVVDARGTTAKAAYLERVLADGGKAIVYANSRTEVQKIADGLRRTLGDVVGFYHAGVGTPERAHVEAFFRTGALRVVVATSAFGEGIDLPDVRHVVLWHLNFSVTEFNQQAGRAGRDGEPASIHLLFGERDRALNEYILDREAPRLETLRAIFGGLRRLARDGVLRGTAEDLVALLDLDRVEAATIRAATRIFVETGLVEVLDDDEGRALRFLPVDGKVDLTASERYAEAQAERDAFTRFCELALGGRIEVLQALVDRPIYPSGIALER